MKGILVKTITRLMSCNGMHQVFTSQFLDEQLLYLTSYESLRSNFMTSQEHQKFCIFIF